MRVRDISHVQMGGMTASRSRNSTITSPLLHAHQQSNGGNNNSSSHSRTKKPKLQQQQQQQQQPPQTKRVEDEIVDTPLPIEATLPGQRIVEIGREASTSFNFQKQQQQQKLDNSSSSHHRRCRSNGTAATGSSHSRPATTTSSTNGCNNGEAATTVTPPLHEESEHTRRLEDSNDPMDVEKGQQQPAAASASSSPTSVTTTLWQRAEHFLDAFTPAQAAAAIQLFHSNMESRVSTVWNDTTTAAKAGWTTSSSNGTNGNTTNNETAQPRNLTSDFDSASQHEQQQPQQSSSSSQSQQDNDSLLGISKLCGPHESLVSSVQQHLPWLVPTPSSPQKAAGTTTTTTTSSATNNPSPPSPSTPPSAAMARRSHRHALKLLVVTSRTHEDIEVTPGHQVKVRLPPTNPTTMLMPSSTSGVLDTTTASTSDQAVATSQSQAQNALTTSMTTDQEGDSLRHPYQRQEQLSSSFSASHKVVSTTSPTTAAAVATGAAAQVKATISSTVGDSSGKQPVPVVSSSAAVVPANPTATAAAATSTTTSKSKSKNDTECPITSLTVRPEEAAELERSISELTMRSSYAATDSALQKIPENRRMAYYAVGKHHRNSGRGGNRRCYFTGKLILGGAPFYAGSVLQGLRTLVVFCLPSAIGLPDKETMLRHKASLPSVASSTSLRGLRLLKANSTNGSGSKTSHLSQYTNHSHNLGAQHAHTHFASSRNNSKLSSNGSATNMLMGHHANTNGNANIHNKRISSCGASTAGSYSQASKSMMSRLSSLDDLSLSVEGDLDPNWSLDRDFLLKVLPPANKLLLLQMATLYPDQFETLPVQVRDASQWKLYVKFCFFSGLPISDGEMHYKVRDEIAEQVYGEEIVLSHDVMEASTGASSAEILTLPNRTVIRYLRKHYSQQCSKLDDRVFQRSSWERVAPEV